MTGGGKNRNCITKITNYNILTEGCDDGWKEGWIVGCVERCFVGYLLGWVKGGALGSREGCADGWEEVCMDGFTEGWLPWRLHADCGDGREEGWKRLTRWLCRRLHLKRNIFDDRTKYFWYFSNFRWHFIIEFKKGFENSFYS